MKKKVLLLSMAMVLLLSGIVSAATNWGKFEGYNIVRLLIDGKAITPKDTPPVILKGRTMVPLTMLEEAGLKVTWDPTAFTVNVETNGKTVPNNHDQEKSDVYALDIFKSLGDTGDRINGLSNSLSTAFTGVTLYNSRSSLDENYIYFDNSVEQYNYYVDLTKEKRYSFSDNEFNDINSILNYYFDAIEDYKSALNYLETIYKKPNDNSTATLFFDKLKSGDAYIYKGLDISNDNYYEIYKYIMNK